MGRLFLTYPAIAIGLFAFGVAEVSDIADAFNHLLSHAPAHSQPARDGVTDHSKLSSSATGYRSFV